MRGEKIGFFSDYPVDGIVPAEITPGVWQKENIYVTLKQGGCPKNAPASLVRREYGDWAAGEEGNSGMQSKQRR